MKKFKSKVPYHEKKTSPILSETVSIATKILQGTNIVIHFKAYVKLWKFESVDDKIQFFIVRYHINKIC